jgi:hypothetical protein
MYWPMEAREALEDAAQQSQTGSLLFGAGVNTDAGVTGVLGGAQEATPGSVKFGLGITTNAGLTGSVDLRSDASTRSMTFGFGVNSDASLTGSIEFSVPAAELKQTFCHLFRTKKGVSANSDSGLSGTIVLNERNFDVILPPVPMCPRFTQPQSAIEPIVPERTVLDNLKALEEADELFDAGKELMRAGHVCEALDLFEKVSRLCERVGGGDLPDLPGLRRGG